MLKNNKPTNFLAVFKYLAFAYLLTTLSYAHAKEFTEHSNSTSIYDHQEKIIGQHWLRSFRGQVKTYNDPTFIYYIENLVNKLLQHNEHNFKGLSVVIVDNPDINAFAVPGGVIGINLGIFLSAGSEGELASIIAHELAHLSLRHYSRGKQQAQEQKVPLYAGILLSAALAATGSIDGAQAVLIGSKATSIHSQLRFSRQFEEEADRVGLHNLTASGYTKNEMLSMFETLNSYSNSSINSKPIEYLLTHPLPNTRISRLKQLQLSKANQNKPKNSLTFELFKTLVEIHYQRRTKVSSHSYAKRLNTLKGNQHPYRTQAAQFGLALQLANEGQRKRALVILNSLLKAQPNELIYHVQYIATLLKDKQFSKALAHIQNKPSLNSLYPMAMLEVDYFNDTNQYLKAQQKLFQLLRDRSDQPLVWYRLSEASGKMKDNIQLHESRAEYHLLLGQFEKAKIQLEYALKVKELIKESSREKAILNKLKSIDQLLIQKKQLGFNLVADLD